MPKEAVSGQLELKALAGLRLRSARTVGLQCPMPNAQCPMPNAQFPIPNSQCPMPHAQH
ncbi:MAG: hypothetical protein F6J93_40725 [Oscillatoria sp. SIO1A7]|nr:hypothetical protein [Oscillatoria sp. SIO1A7]